MTDTPDLTCETVVEALYDVIDPELGYNIVDIGLIYNVELEGVIPHITMTMTTPGCPAQDYIMGGVDHRCRSIPGVLDVIIHLVWDPPWSVVKMSEKAKKHFGIAEE